MLGPADPIIQYVKDKVSIPRVLAVSQSEPNSDLVTVRILQQLLPKNDQCVRLGGKKMIKRNHREEMEEQKKAVEV